MNNARHKEFLIFSYLIKIVGNRLQITSQTLLKSIYFLEISITKF